MADRDGRGTELRRPDAPVSARRRVAGVKVVALLIVCTVAVSLPAGATAEQASQPGSSAAGQIDAGMNHVCATFGVAQVRCWGYGGDGELGYGSTDSVGDDETPASVGPVYLGFRRTAVAVSAGAFHTCALLDDGTVRCWGYNANGQLGYGNTLTIGDNETPGAVGPVELGFGRTAVAISAGGADTCAILDDGLVRCWGFAGDGELGMGASPPIGDNEPVDSIPELSFGPGRTATAISVGGLHACAILDDGSVRCWGYGANGQLGYGTTVNSFTPGPPVNLGVGRTASAISAGAYHTCAILDDGSVRCWGFNGSGELGYGDTNSVGATQTPNTAGPVNLGAGRTAVAISAGDRHTCAILDDGSVRCWGSGADGRLGYGNTTNVGDTPATTPDKVGPVDLGVGRTAVAISAGGSHTCARLDDGTVRCWGYGGNGRLGYCSEQDVGDLQPPASAGPVNLQPGDGGVLCGGPPPVDTLPPSISGEAKAGQTLVEAHGVWSPDPTGYTYQWERCDGAGANCAPISGAGAQSYVLSTDDVASTIRVQETASDAGGAGVAATSTQTAIVTAAAVAASDAARDRGFRTCLAAVNTGAKPYAALTQRGSRRQRARARRRLAAYRRARRRRCVNIYGRTPGLVTGLRAYSRGKAKIELDFTAPGTDGNNPPAAHSYLIKQSLHPISTEGEFNRAPTLCKGACNLAVAQIGTQIIFAIINLRPHTTYYYAIAARDNVTGEPGQRSHTISARTA